MATVAQTFPRRSSSFAWFREFLKEELAPYPGRKALVARMVFTSTLVMIISMTFGLPYGAYGAIYALILSRESLEATASAVRSVFVGFAVAVAYILLGFMVALGDPFLRFVWIVAGFLAGFWALSALRNYAASGRFGYLIAITVTLWDRHVPTSQKVENTLWAAGVITLASVIVLLVEIGFAGLTKIDILMDGILERLGCVETLLSTYASGEPVDTRTQKTISRLAMTGISRLRMNLHRSGFGSQDATEMGAVIALTGRLVDLAGNLPHLARSVSDSDRERITTAAAQIREIRGDLLRGAIPHRQAAESTTPASNLPLLSEIEQTISLIYQAFAGSESLRVLGALPPKNPDKPGLNIRRALLDPEHIRFAIRGAFASTACYVIFNGMLWPEISTAITTCFLTALTTIGASRQKQVLRITGALAGGVVLGMGAQLFVLPSLDSIGGFMLLYIAVIAVAAWFQTSSPRLSYFGVQIAVAFCLINLQEFRFQTSLTVARDRVVGILLGLLMMWLFFDQLWSRPAGAEMKSAFVSALRLLAQLARGPESGNVEQALESTYALRERINAQLDRVRSLADAVLFEFGPSRSTNLEFRNRIRRWQPQFRALFVLRIASLKYRLQTPGFELPANVAASHKAYDQASARILDSMADQFEHGAATPGASEVLVDGATRPLNDAEKQAMTELPAARAQSFVTLLREIDGLTNCIAGEVAAKCG